MNVLSTAVKDRVTAATARRRGRVDPIDLVLVVLGIIAVTVLLIIWLGRGGGPASGSAAAAPQPSATGSSTPVERGASPASSANAVPATTPSAAASAAATSPPSTPAIRSITYTVKPGDNLTVIAAWFHEHGYGALYERNKAVIGADPNLIHPGQRITISRTGMTTSN